MKTLKDTLNQWMKILEEEKALPRGERDNDIIKRAEEAIKNTKELMA